MIVLQGCSTVNGISVKSTGIFSYDVKKESSHNEVASGKHKDVRTIVLLEETKYIPHEKGIQFGIRFIVEGEPINNVVPIDVRLFHPPIKNPETGKMSQISEFTTWCAIGQVHHVGHGYDAEGSLPIGKYLFQLIYEDQVMAEKLFYIYSRT